MKHKNVVSTLFQMLLIVFVFVLVILITSGIIFDFEKIKTAEYWIEVGSQLIMVMVTFNIVFALEKNNRKHDKTGRFYRAYATNKLRVDYIDDNKLHDDLDKACKLENQERLEDKCTILLHKYCTRLTYKDVIGNEEIKPLLRTARANPKYHPELTKLINKIRAGEIKIPLLKPEVFLRDKELGNFKADAYDYNNLADGFAKNMNKFVSFLFLTMAGAIISFSFVSLNFWQVFITNMTLLIGSIVSGLISASKSISFRTLVYENRNSFLARRMDIKEVYTIEENH